MIRYFAQHPTAANLLMFFIVVLGVSVLPDLKRETMPEFSSSEVSVSVIYPGASSEESELALCIPMEDAVDGLSDIEQLSCEAREGVATLTVKMAESGKIERLMADVKAEIDAIDNFPQQIEKPIIKELGRDEPLITLVLSAQLDNIGLKNYAEQLKDKLKRLPGISLVDIAGFSDQQLRVDLSLPMLRQYGLSINDVVTFIQRQNIKLPSGSLETNNKILLLRFDQQQVDATSLGQLVITSTQSGAQVRLADIATISERFEKDEIKTIFDGDRAALLKIKKNKSQDALDLVGVVKTFVEQEQKLVPKGVTLTLTQDMAQVVKDRLKMLLDNAWQGILLVFIVMWLFFAWRYSFWVSMGLPVSFLGAFWIMAQIGVSINMISMVGLLMAIGILMDDAIVIAESIAAHVERGKSTLTGAVEGVKLVGPGVFSSFLTTAAIFLGLAFISGDIGSVMEVFPQVLLATLVVSLIEAFLILPSHLVHSIEHSKNKAESIPAFKVKFNKIFENFRTTTLVNWVSKAVKYRYLTLGGLLALFLLSVTLLAGGLLKFKAFPSLEGDTLEMRVLLPQGTPLITTEKLVKKAVDELDKLNLEYSPKQPEQQNLIQNTTIEYNTNADAFEEGTHLATVRADLLTAETRSTSISELKDRWREAIGEHAGVLSLTFKEPVAGPAGRAIEIRLQANDMAMLSQVSYQVQAELNKFLGVYNVMDDFRAGKEEWQIELLPGALAFGVDGATIANQLRSAFFGEVADEIQRGDESIEIDVRLRKEDKSSVWQLNNYPITLPDGVQIPLSAIAKISPTRGFSRINRVDGIRTVTIIGDIDAELANTSDVINHIDKTIIAEVLLQHPDLTVTYEGEVKEGGSTGKSVMQKFLMGLIGVFIILSFQFRSYFEPVMVMLAIPLALIGTLWGHYLLGFDFTIPSMIGFVSLAGIVVNDSILLVAYIKEHQKEGIGIEKSVVLAAQERFRAVFITSVTTIAGTLPLLLETSLQAQFIQPLVVSLMFGIAASTCLILFMLPSLYVILDEWNLTSKEHLKESQE